LKLFKSADGWEVADFKARSFRREAKKSLQPWIVQTYSTDRYEGPPPITESGTLLSYKEACRVARKVLQVLERERPATEGGESAVRAYYPLGLEQKQVLTYKVIKPSTFLFRTPDQQQKFCKAMDKFSESSGCGLEALALRRTTEGRRKGSIGDVAECIYKLIREGEENPTKALNLTRVFTELERVRHTHLEELKERKVEAEQGLFRMTDARTMDEDARLTGLFVRSSDIVHLE
jgi:hypothetical protein